MDDEGAGGGLDRRTVLFGGLVAAGAGIANVALAHTSQALSTPVAATVVAHVSEELIDVLPAGADKPARVQAIAGASITDEVGNACRLADFAVGAGVVFDTAGLLSDPTFRSQIEATGVVRAGAIMACVMGQRTSA